MINLFEITFWGSFLILLYIYVGYPVLLVVLQNLVPRKNVNWKEFQPKVTLLISCYNEEAVIREKLENVLNLSYPKDKLDVIVISDASSDKTDEIVKEYTDQGISLVRQEERLGKTSGLNLAMQQATGDVIVFTDANAMFENNAIDKLVKKFTNERVGYVVGEARYKEENQNTASNTENSYWQYEIFIKKMESQVHSVVGGDGAIYAIRKELYQPLLETDINDFVNPLQIILAGYRGLYEPDAICWEDSAGDFKKEFCRKIRIINRSFSGLMRVKSVLNPFKTGLFSLEVFSHKLLRWFTFIFITSMGISCLLLALQGRVLFQSAMLLFIGCFWCACLGHVLRNSANQYRIFYLPYYFLLVHIASVLGIYGRFRGKVKTVWTHIREGQDDGEMSFKLAERTFLVLFLISLCIFLIVVDDLYAISLLPMQFCYFFALAVLCYVYFIYPMIIGVISRLSFKKIQRRHITPDVTMLICAYNEETVIEEKIINSLGLDYPPAKIKFIIASDGSIDKTNGIVQRYQNGRVMLVAYPERRGKIQVINDTIAGIDSEIVVFSDANTICEKDVIRKLVRNFNDPVVGGVGADVILLNDETTFGKSESLYYLYERWLQKRESETGSTIGVDGGLYAIRRELYVPPASDTILDDFVISMNVVKKGYRLIFDDEAVGYERSNISYKAEFLRKSRVVAGAVQSVLEKQGIPSIKQKMIFFSYVSHKLLRWLIPLTLVILFYANLHLVFTTNQNIFVATFLGQMLFYVLAILDLAVAKNRHVKLTLIPFYFCLVNGAALYGIYKGLFDRQPVKWQKFDRCS